MSTPDLLSDPAVGTNSLLSRFGTARPATGFVLHVDRCHDSIARRTETIEAPVALRVSWERDAHAGALDLARRLRDRGVACSCDLVAGGDGAVVVGVSGARWSHRGHNEHGTVDAALTALAERVA